MRSKLSEAFKFAAKPVRHAAFGLSFALLSIWFVATSVATIHFEEQIAPVWHGAAQAVSAKSIDITRGLSRLGVLLAKA